MINPKYYRFRVTYHDKYGKTNYYTSNVIVNRKHNITKLTYFAARVSDYILIKQHLYDETHMW